MPTKDYWIYVIEEVDLPDGNLVAVYPLGVNVVLARVADQVFAINGRCPHMGCPLFMGTLSGTILKCQCHDWRFNLRTGNFLDAPELNLKLYQVRFDEGKIYINFN